MITFYVLLVLAASVFGNEDSEPVCSSGKCSLQDPSQYLDELDLNIRQLSLSQCLDLEVLKFVPNLEKLFVANCNSDFKMGIWPSMADLYIISINDCHIPELNKYQFENVINLRELELTGNSIEKLSNDTFYNISGLTRLSLSNNLISALPEGVFNSLKNLYWLDLSFNNISILPKDPSLGNRDLSELKLKGNPLKTIHLDFPLGNFLDVRLINIDLQYCVQLRDLTVSARVGHLYLQNSGLERLEIRGRIKSIHHRNSKVTHADLRGAEFLRPFIHVLCDMPSLEWLDLSNSFKYFKSSIFELSKKEERCTFPNLRFLNMSRIRIRNVPQRFPLFGPNLTTLDLSHNLLVNISLESFAEAHSLQILQLEGNHLTSFDYLSVFCSLKNLQHLALFDNLFNGTFYDGMTKYFGNQNLHLIQKEIRIIPTEDEGTQNHQPIKDVNQTALQEVNQNSKGPNYQIISLSLLAVLFMVIGIVVVFRKNIYNINS